MACHSSRAKENLNSGFTPLVERLHSFNNIDIPDASYVNRMKDFLHGNYDDAICSLNQNKIDSAKMKQNEKTKNVSDNSIKNKEKITNNESEIDRNKQKDSDKCENKCMDVDKIKTEVEDENEDVDDSMSDSYNVPSSSTEKNTNNTEDDEDDDRMVIDTVVEDDVDNTGCSGEFTGLQNDNGIYTKSHVNKKAKLSSKMSETTVSECDSTSAGSDFVAEQSLASEIADSIQLGDMVSEPQKDMEKEDVVPESSSEAEPKKERWTMKIKVGSTSDGSRCEIIKQMDYEDAKKNGLIQDGVKQKPPSDLPTPYLMHVIQPLNSSSSSTTASPNDIKSVVGKRKKEKKGLKNVEPSISMAPSAGGTPPKKLKGGLRSDCPSAGGTPPKKLKGGLRSDCPSFCRSNCTKVHHPLLVSARRMIENDSNTTIIFLEEVSRYYGGDLGQMTPATEIHDPWKDTSYPLLHYLSLMGKCSGCFALVDAGQSCMEAVTSTGETVLHTIIKEIYNFNCTHGHMDILLKKFTILLKEFGSCLTMQNHKMETPLHILGKLISDTANLIKIPGKFKVPYRLYQFSKNMLLGCLEQFTNMGLDPEILNRQDINGNTVAHYIAQDRASSKLLDMLLEKGAELNILNNSQQSIEDIKDTAPPPPDGEVLQMAEFSAKGNKYKKAVNKKTKMTLCYLKAQNLGKTEPEKNTEIISEKSSENFMEMINSRLSDGSNWEPIENLQLKKKADRKTKVVPTSSPNKISKTILKTLDSKVNATDSTKFTSNNDTKLTISVPSSSVATIIAPSSSTTTSMSTISLPKVSSSIADVTTTKASTTTLIPPEAIKVEKPDEPSYSVSNPVSDTSVVVTLSKISTSVKTSAKMTIPKVSVAVVSTPQTKLQIDKLSHISIPNVRPAILPATSSQTKYPIISNVQSIAKQGLQGMRNGIQENIQNAHMYHRPQGPPPIAQRPRHKVNLPTNQPTLVPRPSPSPSQPSSSSGNSQQPLLLKTADGKLMSINVVQVSKGMTQTSTTWNPPLNIPQNVNIYPVAPHQRPQFIDPNNVRYISPSMVSNSYRTDSNRNMSSMTHPRPIVPNIFPFRGNHPPSSQHMNHNYSQPSVFHHRFVQQPLPNGVHLQSKNQKNRGLEASIENLRHSAMNSNHPTGTTKHKHSNNVNKSRLSSTLKNQPDESPRVIILDEESSVKTTDTRELQSPSIESSQDLNSPQDVDGVASFMKNYLEEKGSIEDFLKFSNEKRKGLVKELEEERKRIRGINNEIILREVDIKDTRESVVSKEMEIAHLRLKLTKIQSDVNQLKNNRRSLTDTCSDIEKRMKNLEEQTMLFTSWSTDTGRIDK